MTRECHVRFCERLRGKLLRPTHHLGMTSPQGEGRAAGAVPTDGRDSARLHKAHIGVDADAGLVHTVIGTAANVNDVVPAYALLHGGETDLFGDAGYQGAHKRPDAKQAVNWHVAMRPGKGRALDEKDPVQRLTDETERIKASVRAKVEHPFRVIKRQFGHVKVRYRGLKKNTAQLMTLFALSNLRMVRGKLMSTG